MEGLREVAANWLSSEGILKGNDTVCQESALSITISNGSANSAQVQVESTTNNINWTSLGTQTITGSQPYVVNNVLTTNYIIYRYRYRCR